MKWRTTVEDHITDMLMEHGCSVTKPGVEALVEWINERDKELHEEIKRNNEWTFENRTHVEITKKEDEEPKKKRWWSL